MRRLLKARSSPFTMHDGMVALIRAEGAGVKGKRAHHGKDEFAAGRQVIEELYKAQPGQDRIDLIVREVCVARRRVGLSENIRVRSIVGRFISS